MADFRTDPKLLTPLVASASFPVSLAGVTYAADDYVIFGLVCSASSGTVSETSGLGTTWILKTLYVASGCRMVIGYAKVAAGPTISAPTITISAGTPNWQGWVGSLFDVDPSTFLAGSVATVDPAAAASSATTGAMTPTSDGALLLYFTSSRNSQATYTRFLPGDVVGRLLQGLDDGSTVTSMAVGTVQQGTAAATAKTFYSNVLTSNRIGGMVIPIKNKTSGVKARHGVGGITKVAWLGDFGAQHDTNITWGAPDNGGTTWDGAGNINGIAVDATDALDAGTPTALAPTVQWGTMASISSATITTSKWAGRKATFSSAVDMSGKLFSTEWVLPLLGTQVGAEGILLVFKDSSGYWEAFQLSAKLDVKVYTLNTSVIDLANATPYASGGGGTLNLADVTSIHPFIHRTGSSGTRRAFWLRNWNLLAATTIKGGSSTSKLTPEFLDKVMNGWGYAGICSVQGNAVVVKSDVQIGDGSMATYYDATATLVNFPAAYDALSQREVQVGANALEIRILASASDTINDIASATAGAQEQDWIIDPSSSASATYSIAGKSFVNMNPTLLAGETFTSPTFSGCGPVKTKGANLTSFIVADTTATSTEASVVVDANGSTLSGGTTDVTGTDAGYHLELASGVKDITLANHTFTGSAATNKVHALKTAATVAAGAFVTGDHYEIKTVGTTDFTLIGASANTIGVRFTATGAGSGTGDAYAAVKITISGTTSLAEADVTSAGAVVWVAAPELYQEVAIAGLAATYRLQIFDIEYVMTVSGITVTPTAGATYTHGGITWTVRSASITAGAGTITVYGTGTPAASGTLTKTGGTGDASVAFSAYVVDGTELYIGVPGATSYTWTDSVAAAAPRVIRVRVMEDGPGTSDAIEMIDAIVGMCGITEGTESVGYLVAAVADDVYNDRGVDGSAITGITIDDTTLRLEIASGAITNYNGTDVLVVDGRDLYAYETYWLGTTAGMRDEARFIEAIDAVNFRCSNFKLLGTSGYPILIRNCYMVDAATGIFASLVDYSGDPISNAPDHMAAIVVSTSDSVVTGTLSEFIAAVPTAATNASATRTELATELARLDVVVSSRASGAAVSAIPDAGANATATRSELATELARLDVAVSSRASGAAVAEIPDAGANATAVRSELAVELAAVVRARKLLNNKRVVDPDTGLLTVYDDDGTTVLGSGLAYLDAAGTQPYDGGGPIHRTEAME